MLIGDDYWSGKLLRLVNLSAQIYGAKKFTAPVIITNQHSLECSGKPAQKF